MSLALNTRRNSLVFRVIVSCDYHDLPDHADVFNQIYLQAAISKTCASNDSPNELDAIRCKFCSHHASCKYNHDVKRSAWTGFVVSFRNTILNVLMLYTEIRNRYTMLRKKVTASFQVSSYLALHAGQNAWISLLKDINDFSVELITIVRDARSLTFNNLV